MINNLSTQQINALRGAGAIGTIAASSLTIFQGICMLAEGKKRKKMAKDRHNLAVEADLAKKNYYETLYENLLKEKNES